MRKINATALQHIAFFDDTAHSAAALWPIPLIPFEGIAIDLFQTADDGVLQVEKKLFDSWCVHASSRFLNMIIEYIQ